MLPVLNYIQQTNWKKFRKDCEQYKELKKYCKELKRSVFAARGYILCEDLEGVSLSCIRSGIKDQFNFNDPDGISIAFGVEYCQHFSPDCSEYNLSKCHKESCPYSQDNHNYCEVLEKYKFWLDKRDRFWHEKFLRAR